MKATLPFLLLIVLCTACQLGRDRSTQPMVGPALPPGFQLIQTPDLPHISENSLAYLSPNPSCTADHVKLLARFGKGPATAIAWSPDKSTLVISSNTGTYLYDIARKVQTTFLDTSSYEVSSALFSPDGSFLLLASSDGLIHLWNIATQKETALMDEARRASLPEGGKGLRSMTFSDDGKLLATIDVRNNFLLWRMPDGTPYLFADKPLQGDRIQFLNDEKRIALIGSGVRIYRLSDGKILFGFNLDPQSVSIVSPDGMWMATGYPDGRLIVWQLELQRIKFQEDLCQGYMCGTPIPLFSPNGDLLAVSLYGTLKLWDPTSGNPIGTIFQEDITSFEFSPDGRKLSVVSESSVKLYNVSGGSPIRNKKIDYSEIRYMPKNEAHIKTGFSKDNQWFAYIENGTPAVWTVQNGQDWWIKPFEEFYDINATYFFYFEYMYSDNEYGLYVDESHLVVPESRGNTKIWDIRYRALQTTLSGFRNPFPVTGNSNPPLTATVAERNTITIRKSNSTDILFNLVVPHVLKNVFSPDYKYLATSQDDGVVRIWEMVSGKSIAGFAGEEPSFSPDGSYLVSYTGEAVNINRTSNWEQVMTIDRKFYGMVVTFWPDKNTLLMTGGDITRGYYGPRLVNVLDGKTVLKLPLGERALNLNPPELVIVHGPSGTVELWGCE